MSNLNNLQGQPWTPGPLHPVLGENEIHVWRVSADLDASAIRQCRYVLSEDELARAEAFRFELDRDRWIAARGLLRVVLGRYLYREPAHIEFREPPLRKPTLVLSDNDIDIRFNISHSDGVALFVVAVGREVGIDVERVRGDFDFGPVAAQVFSEREVAALEGASEQERNRRFFSHWTCKEAYVKTIGMGLSYPMSVLTVEMRDGGRVDVTEDAHKAGIAPTIVIKRLSVGPDHCAAVACVGEMYGLRCWHGPDGIPIGLWRPSADADRFAA